jgi:hypothetical protein
VKLYEEKIKQQQYRYVLKKAKELGLQVI